MAHPAPHIGIPDSPVDLAVDLANEALDAIHGAQTDERGPFACVEQLGQEAGAQGAQADLAAGTVASAALSQHVPYAFEQAYADCGVAEHADYGSYSIPSLTNPVVTFLDIVTQPSQANGGEAEYFQARDLYEHAVDTGYHQTALEAFQHQLDDRLSIDWSTPGANTGHDAPGHGSVFDIPAIGFVDTPASASSVDAGAAAAFNAGSPAMHDAGTDTGGFGGGGSDSGGASGGGGSGGDGGGSSE